MHNSKKNLGGRKSVANLVGYGFYWLVESLDGVQGVGGSNPLAPTNDFKRLAFVLAFFVLTVRRFVRRWGRFLRWICGGVFAFREQETSVGLSLFSSSICSLGFSEITDYGGL